MEIKFRKGGRVVAAIGSCLVAKGWTGTVAEDSFVPYVDWDNGVKFAIPQDNLEPITTAPSKSAMDLYQELKGNLYEAMKKDLAMRKEKEKALKGLCIDKKKNAIVYDLKYKPEGLTIQDVLRYLKEDNVAFVDSSSAKRSQADKPFGMEYPSIKEMIGAHIELFKEQCPECYIYANDMKVCAYEAPQTDLCPTMKLVSSPKQVIEKMKRDNEYQEKIRPLWILEDEYFDISKKMD